MQLDLAWNDLHTFKPIARVEVRILRRNTAGPGIKSLTYCEANRTKV